MATVTDVEVANASFPTVRQDLNDILEAIATNFSADAEPTTTYPNQWWYETDTNKLYIRNEGNDAWIHVLTLDQTTDTVSSVEGVSADAISEGNSSVEVIDTGTGYVQINVDGAEVARLDATGLGIGTTSPTAPLHIYSASANRPVIESNSTSQAGLIFKNTDREFRILNGSSSLSVYDSTAGSERMRIDSSGRMLIGSTSSVANDTGLQVNGTAFADSAIAASRFSNDGSPTHIIGQKSRSGTIGGNTVVQNADVILRIGGYASDGVDMATPVGHIDFVVDGTPGSNDMPGRITFNTTPNGSNAALERMVIKNNGDVLIGATAIPGTSTTSGGAGFEINSSQNRSIFRLGHTVDSSSQRTMIGFYYKNAEVGYISSSNSITAYNTSSDYRLKENVVDMAGAIDRVKALKPSQFNFIASPDRTVDGFIAHEVQDIVPEAVTGEKDGMRTEEYEVSPALGDIFVPAVSEVLDGEGNVVTEAQDEQIISSDVERPETLEEGQQWRETTAAVMGEREVPKYQGIDQSKLVPLLTGALQEAIAKIEALEARIAALEA